MNKEKKELTLYKDNIEYVKKDKSRAGITFFICRSRLHNNATQKNDR